MSPNQRMYIVPEYFQANQVLQCCSKVYHMTFAELASNKAASQVEATIKSLLKYRNTQNINLRNDFQLFAADESMFAE